MKKMEEILKREIDNLVETGNRILSSAISLRSEMKGQELAEVTSWVTRLGQLIRELYGAESQQFLNYTSALKTENFYYIHSEWNAQISQMCGIALSMKYAYENGLLVNIRALVQADIFADFLEMGEYLLKEGYKDAAAVIIGAVLEDSLKKLCEKNGISICHDNGKQLTIDPLNAALSKAEIYSKLNQKQITTWAHIRNKAAHGEYNEYEKNQVEMMLLFVQSFAEQYLT
jgi:hypothetical protein